MAVRMRGSRPGTAPAAERARGSAHAPAVASEHAQGQALFQQGERPVVLALADGGLAQPGQAQRQVVLSSISRNSPSAYSERVQAWPNRRCASPPSPTG